MSQSEWLDKDFYADLGVSSTASHDDIRKAYRKLARESHPDSHPGDAAAEERFKRISAAYDVVGDDAKRKEYDQIRAMGRSGFSGGFRASNGHGAGPDFDISDLFGHAGTAGPGAAGGFSDILGGLFNRSAAGGPQARAASGRGEDIETSLTVGFREAATGEKVEFTITASSTCRTCSGSGAKPGTSPHECSVCSGSGFVNRTQGAFGFSEPCPNCGGQGTVIDTPCPECGGAGVTTRPRSMSVKIPAGIEDGKRIRLPGKGQAGFRGAPAGDLYVTIKVRSDEVFSRDGMDLLVDVPVSYPELIRGGTVSIPTLDGRVTVRIPENSKDGQVLRVRGRGITPATGARGDLRATLCVVTPPAGMASEELRAYAEALDAAGFDPRSGWRGA